VKHFFGQQTRSVEVAELARVQTNNHRRRNFCEFRYKNASQRCPKGFQNVAQGHPRSGRTLGRSAPGVQSTPKGFQNGRSQANTFSGDFCNPLRVGLDRVSTDPGCAPCGRDPGLRSEALSGQVFRTVLQNCKLGTTESGYSDIQIRLKAHRSGNSLCQEVSKPGFSESSRCRRRCDGLRKPGYETSLLHSNRALARWGGERWTSDRCSRTWRVAVQPATTPWGAARRFCLDFFDDT
jgi:hypothetical protein